MGDTVKFLFAPVGLGGMGVDLTKSRPLEFWTGPKKKTVAPYNEQAEKEKIANKNANVTKARLQNQTQTVLTQQPLNDGQTLLGN